MEQAGFQVKWDGTFKERIRVPDITWQKR
ncbi:DUF6891 domain-containing protein [Gimesia panareensis]